MRCITVNSRSHLFLAGKPMIPTHNSWALLLEPVRHLRLKDFKGVIFRKSCPEITNPGGLWDESDSLYSHLGGSPFVSKLRWEFPTGAKVEMDHLEDDAALKKWQGAQVAYIGFDELTHFSERQFFYMLSRMRSLCGIKPYMRATCNPDASSWVAGLLEWWIDQETGYPIPERSGVVRWFVRVDGDIVWADSRDALIKQYGKHFAPKSLTFIPARLEDNPTLTKRDPGYLANLQALPYVDQQRLLYGNWKILDTEGAEFPPEYFDQIWGHHWPTRFELSTIGVDPSKGKGKGDYQAAVFMGVSGGLLWVDAWIAKTPTTRLVSEVIDMAMELSPEAIGVEINTHADLMAVEFDRQCAERGLPPLRFHPIENVSVRKDVRIRSLGLFFKRHMVRFRPDSKGCKTLEYQFRHFGLRDVHDDGPDAMEMAHRTMSLLLAGRRHEADVQEVVYA